MSYCVLPGCVEPQNPDTAKFCARCGSKLVLKQRYRPIQSLGAGGFGRTFLAVDEYMPSKPRCVVKQLCFQGQSSAGFHKATELFLQEAERLEDLGRHAQIPKLLAHFEQNRLLYLVQELIEGQTLAEELQTQGCFDEVKVWELLQELSLVLQYVHEHHVIHRDIKPANIIRRGRDRKPVLIDFGVAKLITASALLRTGTTVGSLEYMAPEQSRGKALPASDLYSLGVTCVHLITQVSPFDLFDVQDNVWCWRDRIPPGTRISDRLGTILDKLLQSAVSQRYQSARELLRVLKRQSVKIDPSAQRSSSKPSIPPPSSPQAPTLVTAVPSPAPTMALSPRSPAAAKGPLPLVSVQGIDYHTLRNLLAASQWQDADRETGLVLCQVVGKGSSPYFASGDFKKCACDDLQILDALWLRYSRKRFGFSVQVQLFISVSEDYGQFCDRVNWPTHNSPNFIQELTFNRSAPKGHLPSRAWIGGTQWWKHMAFLSDRLTHCGMINR